MTDHTPHNPNTGDQPSSDEYGFDDDREPLEKADSPEAEAAEYGIYGYSDHAAKEMRSVPPYDRPDVPEQVDESETGDESREGGGQELTETEHGAGFDQPMDPPQRRASRSDVPPEDEA